MKRTTKGFTLIELIIVIAVISVLSTIVLIIIENPSGRADAKKTRHNVAQVVRLVEQYRIAESSTDEIATKIAALDLPIGEKVAGSIPYLIDLRNNAKRNNFCNTTGIGYNYLLKLNNNNQTEIYTHTTANETGQTDLSSKTIICKNNSTGTNGDFAIAGKITESVWSCGAYGDTLSAARYFNVNTGNTKLKINCYMNNGSFQDETNSFFESLNTEYNSD